MEHSLLYYLQELKNHGLDDQATTFDQTKAVPFDLINQLSKEGFIQVGFPKEIGGDGTTFKDHLEIIRELSISFPALSSIFLTQSSFAVWPVYKFGTQQQKDKHLNFLINGDSWGPLL